MDMETESGVTCISSSKTGATSASVTTRVTHFDE